MRKAVRKLLTHYDRFGIIALVLWLAALVCAISLPFIMIQYVVVSITGLNDRLSSFTTTVLVSPIVVYVCPPLWAAGFLLNERIWMLVGIHKFMGWESFHIRKMIGKMAGEAESSPK